MARYHVISGIGYRTPTAEVALSGGFAMMGRMVAGRKALTAEEVAEAKSRRFTGMRLQAIESNPLDADDVAMFEMFEREAWPHERRRAYIIDRARTAAMIPAAE